MKYNIMQHKCCTWRRILSIKMYISINLCSLIEHKFSAEVYNIGLHVIVDLDQSAVVVLHIRSAVRREWVTLSVCRSADVLYVSCCNYQLSVVNSCTTLYHVLYSTSLYCILAKWSLLETACISSVVGYSVKIHCITQDQKLLST